MLGFWVALTLAAQVSTSARRALSRFDPLYLLPNWRFFSPRPRQADYVVLVRCKPQAAGVPGTWKCIEHAAGPAVPLIYNKRLHKAWLDMSTLLFEVALAHGQAFAVRTAPYLAIVDALPQEMSAYYRQFALGDVLSGSKGFELRLIYVSAWIAPSNDTY